MWSSVLNWISDFFNYLFVEVIYGGILDSFASIIASIGVPEFMTSLASAAGTVASGPFGWAWSLMQFGPGLTMVASAYALRFVLRRIPFIGG